MIDLYWIIHASVSQCFYYKTLLWNFKYCLVQTENVFYWFTVKQLIFNHVSLCQGMLFLLDFLYQLVNLGYSIDLRFSVWKRFAPSICHQNQTQICLPWQWQNHQKRNVKLIFVQLPHQSVQYDEVPPKCQVWRDWYWAFNRKKIIDFDYYEEHLRSVPNKVKNWFKLWFFLTCQVLMRF